MTGRFEWERAVRVLVLPSTTKLVALMLATYATAKDGANIRPGEDRLAADCALSTRAVRTHLAALRDLGLIERTTRGSANQHRRAADTYALRIPDDLLEKVEILHDYPGLGLPRDRKHRSGTKPAATGTPVPPPTRLLPERNDRATGT